MGRTNSKKLIHYNIEALYRLSPVEVHRFIDFTIKFCKKNKLNINVSDADVVNLLGSDCAGSFGAKDRTLNVAVGVPFEEWFPVYVHEFCHANQFVDNPEWFSKLDVGSDNVFLWTAGEEFSDEVLDSSFADSILLESDCEHRACEAIVHFGLENIINVKEYAQKGNAYVNYYQHFRKTRKWWVTGKTPYLLPEIYMLFPEEVIIGGVELTEEQTKAFEACTIP